MVGFAVYILVDVVLRFLPPHYSVISDAERILAVGPFGSIINLYFLGRDVTTLCGFVAINRAGHASSLRRGGEFLTAVGVLCTAVLAFSRPTLLRVPGWKR